MFLFEQQWLKIASFLNRDSRRKNWRLHKWEHNAAEFLEDRRMLSATIINVTTTNDIIDSGDGLTSLREAIIQANTSSADFEIQLPAGTYTLSITGQNENSAATGDLDILRNGSLKILGDGANSTIIDAAGIDRVFDVKYLATVTFEGITISGGQTPTTGSLLEQSGGGILINGSYITINQTVITNNTADQFGGGIYNNDGEKLVISQSTFHANTAGVNGGAIFSSTLYSVTITNSTLSGNSAGYLGGAIYTSISPSYSSHFTILHSTIAKNTTDPERQILGNAGDGIYNELGSVVLHHSILANGYAGNTNLNASSSYNFLATSGTGLTHGENGNIIVHSTLAIVNSTLADNGGPTPTHALYARSPAIDAGNPDIVSPPEFDQRGSGFSRVVGAAIDIGAVEYIPPAPIVVTTAVDENDGTAAPGTGAGTSLREAIIAANADPDESTIQFDASLNGTNILLSLAGINEDGALTGDLDITEDLIIEGNGEENTIINANSIDRVFEVFSGTWLTIKNTTITGGSITGKGGGIFHHGNFLKIFESTISDNMANNDGGGIYSDGYVLIITKSKISNNSSNRNGAGIYTASPYVNMTILGSTISGNSAKRDGGGIYNLGGIKINESTISGNSTERNGGGIYDSRGTTTSFATIANITLSGNSAHNSGGGLYINNDYLDISHSTLTGNRADADGNGSGTGGGIDATNNAQVLNHLLIAGNLRGDGNVADDFAGTATNNSSYNLIGNAATAGGLTDGTNGNIIGNAGSGTLTISKIIDPVLSDNGGLTLSHAIAPRSIAIDAGNPNVSNPSDFDQRGDGYDRIVNSVIDVGAFEYSSKKLPATSIAGYVNGNWWVSSPDANNDYSTSRWAQWQTANLLKVVNGDFNGDGLQDIAAWLPNGEWRVGLARTNKSYSFQKWTTWRTTGVKEIHVGDFDNDGKDDIAALFQNGSQGNWWVARSTGTQFTASMWGIHGNYDGIEKVLVGNFDGINGDDLAVLSTNGKWWMSLTTNSHFVNRHWNRWDISHGANHFLVGDFDANGKDDVAALFGTAMYRKWWVGLSTGNRFVNRYWATWKVAQNVEGVVAGDFDGDGATDIAGLFNQKDWWVGIAGANKFVNTKWAQWNFAANGISDIQIGSSNGDGKQDIFARRNDTGEWLSLESTGAAFTTRTLVTWSTSANWQHVQVGAMATASSIPAPDISYAIPPRDAEKQILSENKQPSKKESSVLQQEKREAERYEVFGSSELLDMLFSI